MSVITPPIDGAEPLGDGPGWRVLLPPEKALAAVTLGLAARRAELRARPWRQLLAARPAPAAEVRVLSHLELLVEVAAAGRPIGDPAWGAEGGFSAAVAALLRSLREPTRVETWAGDRLIGRSQLSLPASVDTVWGSARDREWDTLHVRVAGLVAAQISVDAEIIAAVIGVAVRAARAGGAPPALIAEALWRRAGLRGEAATPSSPS